MFNFINILDHTIDTRFEKPEVGQLYFRNSFAYATRNIVPKPLRVRCKTIVELYDTKCCRIELPIRYFDKQSVESEFDLLVSTPAEAVKLKTYWLRSTRSQLRLEFRKSILPRSLQRVQYERFCFEVTKYGRYGIRFDIVAPCYSTFKTKLRMIPHDNILTRFCCLNI